MRRLSEELGGLAMHISKALGRACRVLYCKWGFLLHIFGVFVRVSTKATAYLSRERPYLIIYLTPGYLPAKAEQHNVNKV